MLVSQLTLTNGLKMDGSLARGFMRYDLFESVPVLLPPPLRVNVPYGLASQLPSSDDPSVFLPFNVFNTHTADSRHVDITIVQPAA